MIAIPLIESTNSNLCFIKSLYVKYKNKKSPNLLKTINQALEATIGFEPMNQGVADPRLTAWLCRHYDSDGNRTRVTAVKGRCLNRLTTEPYVSHERIINPSQSCLHLAALLI